MTRTVTMEEMLQASEVDATALEAAIREKLAEVGALVGLRVLSEILVAEARKLHGVTMKIVIEPET